MIKQTMMTTRAFKQRSMSWCLALHPCFKLCFRQAFPVSQGTGSPGIPDEYQLDTVLCVICWSGFQSAAALFASEGVLPHSTFLLLAQPLRPLYKGVAQADMNAYDLIWAPFIEHSERAEFEAK
jgi:hypothetical protein